MNINDPEFNAKNQRRLELLDKQVNGNFTNNKITTDEQIELNYLEKEISAITGKPRTYPGYYI